MTRSLPQSGCKRGSLLGWCGRRGLGAALALLLAACWSGAAEDPAAAALKLEYKLKAGFLYNFAKFVVWPTNAPGDAAKLPIGVVDEGAAFPVLESELAHKQVEGRTIEVVRCRQAEDLKRCAIVFIARAESGRFKEWQPALGGAPVLTVGESDGFATGGGCINFVRRGENVRFEVNLAAVERAGLKISSKLSSIAIVVPNEEVRP